MDEDQDRMQDEICTLEAKHVDWREVQLKGEKKTCAGDFHLPCVGEPSRPGTVHVSKMPRLKRTVPSSAGTPMLLERSLRATVLDEIN